MRQISAVTHPAPASVRKSSMRVLVIIPRSPANTSSVRPKSFRVLSAAVLNAIASAVLPGKMSSPSFSAMTCAAATFPCGIDRSTSKADSASTRVAPFSASRNAAIALFGSADKFASVSLRGLPLASR